MQNRKLFFSLHLFLVPDDNQSETGASKEVPIRSYLDTTVNPLLLEALAHISKTRPERPVEALADYLEEHNQERRN